LAWLLAYTHRFENLGPKKIRSILAWQIPTTTSNCDHFRCSKLLS